MEKDIFLEKVEAELRALEAKVRETEAAEKSATQAATEARELLAAALRQAAHQGLRLSRFDYEVAHRKSIAQTNVSTR